MKLPIEYRLLLKPKNIDTNVRKILKDKSVHTVCQEALCPNRGECFKNNTATFLIMGSVCTRKCKFCAIQKGIPEKIDKQEIKDIILSIKQMNSRYVVITSVTRDDIEDGGASYFNEVCTLIKKNFNDIKIEILIPDLNKNPDNLDLIKEENFEVLNHNLETVKYLYDDVRPEADYEISKKILFKAKKKGLITKTGIMVGLGETEENLEELFDEIKDFVDIMTIGQYIMPSKEHYPVMRYYTQNEFDKIKDIALNIGIKRVVSGIFVRSSYKAHDSYIDILSKNGKISTISTTVPK